MVPVYPSNQCSPPCPMGEPPLVRRVAGGLRRRAAWLWSRLVVGERPPTAEIAFAVLTGGLSDEGSEVPVDCPSLLGAAIETLRPLGADDIARRWGQWLVSRQGPDGSLPERGRRIPSPVATAWAARGWWALRTEMPELDTPLQAACHYLHAWLGTKARSGRLDTLDQLAPTERIALAACLPLLRQAAALGTREPWETSVRSVVQNARQLDVRHVGNPATDEQAWSARLAWADALRDLGASDAAARMLDAAESTSSRANSAQLALLAACLYRLGRRESADRLMHRLRRRIAPGGRARSAGLRGQRSRLTSLWTAKHYLDAAVLQVRAAFEAEPEGVPEAIDPTDGRVEAVRQWLRGLPEDCRIAEPGCGRGRYLRHVSRWMPSAQLVGIDIAPAMLRALPAGVEGLEGSLLRIPTPDGAFDAAFAVESLEHALLPSQAVAELCRVVRPGGRVLIIDKDRACQALSHHQPWERWYTPAELQGWLARHCTDVRVAGVSHLEGRPGNRLFLTAQGIRRSHPTV